MNWVVAMFVGLGVGTLVGTGAAVRLNVARLRRADALGRTGRAEIDRLAEELGHLRPALDALPFGFGLYVRRELETSNRSFAGLTTNDRLGLTVRAAVERQRSRVGQHLSEELVDFAGPPRRVLHIGARPVSGGRAVVVTIEDVTALERLESVRRDFVANISHELRSPVGALALLAEAIADESNPAVTSRLAGRLSTEAHRLGRIIEDLLELSRLEGGAAPDLETHRLRSLVDEAVGRVGPIAELREVTVDTEGVGPESVRVDPRQLVTAISNLVDNAVRYSDAGKRVEVSSQTSDDGVQLLVEDHGVGIPSHAIDRVFERFYRVDSARTRESGGTGLGLAIVRHVASNHGGDVSVASTEGFGSRFTLRLPGPASAPPSDCVAGPA